MSGECKTIGTCSNCSHARNARDYAGMYLRCEYKGPDVGGRVSWTFGCVHWYGPAVPKDEAKPNCGACPESTKCFDNPVVAGTVRPGSAECQRRRARATRTTKAAVRIPAATDATEADLCERCGLPNPIAGPYCNRPSCRAEHSRRP